MGDDKLNEKLKTLIEQSDKMKSHPDSVGIAIQSQITGASARLIESAVNDLKDSIAESNRSSNKLSAAILGATYLVAGFTALLVLSNSFVWQAIEASLSWLGFL